MEPELTHTEWDVVVVGTGMGGSVTGFELARRGHRVLFLERGPLVGGFWPAAFVRQWPGELETMARLPVGCGAGGSTAVYGMVLERFFREDFRPDLWPVKYEELEPYYTAAERLFRVRGTGDPLRGDPANHLLPPPPPTSKEVWWTDRLATLGLHPYRSHHACERVPGCAGCRGTPCARACRNDAARIALLPAIEQHGAQLLTDCGVERVELDGRRASAVHARRHAQAITVRARLVVLATGAFQTPRLLWRSLADRFPDALEPIGRNLMFHVSDAFALTEPGLEAGAAMAHGISFNDHYSTVDGKLGNVFVQPHTVEGELTAVLARKGVAVEPSTVLLATILEDLPYPGNRVLPPGSDDVVRFRYDRPAELDARNERFRAALERALGPSLRRLTDDDNLNWAHACGTCRMGRDPADSVVDAENRCHELDNVYVLDASFFPSSAGINPSLTIAANALRVAERLSARLG